jgi:isopenicillin-N N-acyltransferase-like protein
MEPLVLEGTPRERGKAHGEALKPLILDHVERWMDALGRTTGRDPNAYIAQFLDDTAMLVPTERWAPDLLEEVHGIAEGAGIDFKTVFALNLSDEEWWYRRELLIDTTPFVQQKCSALGVFGQADAPALLAQTIDSVQYRDGLQVLLRIKEPTSHLETLVFTFAGIHGVIGVNSQSVGVCGNTVFQLSHAADGLPVFFITRGILSRSTAASAAAFVQGVKHASGQNYIIGTPEAAIDFECSARKVCQFVPQPGAGYVYHTNHPVVNDDRAMERELLQRAHPDRRKMVDGALKHSKARLADLESGLTNASVPIDVETIKSILSSHEAPICCHKQEGGGGFTVACLIMVLSTPPELHFAPGPPCSTGFETFTI